MQTEDDQSLENLIDGELIERIDLRELKPAFDGNHEHQFVPDPDDVTDGYRAEVCSVEGCWMGRLVAV